MPRGNKIQIRTGNGVPSPADFATSEPAWDGVSKFYIKNAAGAMVEIGGGGGGSPSLVVAASASAFPATGSESALYLDESTSRIFQWDSGVYVEVGGSGGGVSHASTHAIGGGDAITITSAQVSDFATAAAAAAPATTNASLLTSGTLADARLSANVVLTSDARLSDARTPTDGSVTDAKITSGGLSTSSLNWAAIQTWQANTNYAKGDLVANNGIAYRRSTAGTSGATFNSANWQQITPSTFLASQISGLGTTLQRFTARDNQPPASGFATLDTRNSVLVLEFDSTNEESATFVGVVNDAVALTNGLAVRLWWMADTATSGNVRWGVQLERSGTDLDADSYDANAQVTSAANATCGIESVAQITITTIDSLVAGDRFRLRVYRVAADATNDTMTGDAQLIAVEVRTA